MCIRDREKQFHNAYLKAESRPGKTGENLLQIMECRLDNVVFRLGFAPVSYTHLGVMPIIFASALVSIPGTIGSFLQIDQTAHPVLSLIHI